MGKRVKKRWEGTQQQYYPCFFLQNKTAIKIYPGKIIKCTNLEFKDRDIHIMNITFSDKQRTYIQTLFLLRNSMHLLLLLKLLLLCISYLCYPPEKSITYIWKKRRAEGKRSLYVYRAIYYLNSMCLYLCPLRT